MDPRVPRLPDEEGYWYPNWRVRWDESLDATSRSRIARAVRKGLPLTDQLKARFAVTLAERDRRIWRWWPLFSFVYLSFELAVLWFLSRVPVSDWEWPTWSVAVSASAVVLLFPGWRIGDIGEAFQLSL